MKVWPRFRAWWPESKRAGALIVHLRYLWPFISDIVGVHTHQWSHTCLLQVSPRSVLLVLASCLFRCLHARIPSLLNCITSVSLTLFACRYITCDGMSAYYHTRKEHVAQTMWTQVAKVIRNKAWVSFLCENGRNYFWFGIANSIPHAYALVAWCMCILHGYMHVCLIYAIDCACAYQVLDWSKLHVQLHIGMCYPAHPGFDIAYFIGI